MMGDAFRWNEWNEDHIGSHGVSPEDAEYVVDHATSPYPEQIGDGKWRVRGQISTGYYIQVVYIFDPDDTVYVIHARGLSDHEKRQLRRRLR